MGHGNCYRNQEQFYRGQIKSPKQQVIFTLSGQGSEENVDRGQIHSPQPSNQQVVLTLSRQESFHWSQTLSPEPSNQIGFYPKLRHGFQGNFYKGDITRLSTLKEQGFTLVGRTPIETYTGLI